MASMEYLETDQGLVNVLIANQEIALSTESVPTLYRSLYSNRFIDIFKFTLKIVLIEGNNY